MTAAHIVSVLLENDDVSDPERYVAKLKGNDELFLVEIDGVGRSLGRYRTLSAVMGGPHYWIAFRVGTHWVRGRIANTSAVSPPTYRVRFCNRSGLTVYDERLGTEQVVDILGGQGFSGDSKVELRILDFYPS